MAAFSRNKGKRGEREVSALIRELTGWDAQRRVRQHGNDSDVLGVPGWAVEVKNCATLDLPGWWRQATTQAQVERLLPVLFYKLPYRGWRTLWPLSAVIAGQEEWTGIAWTCDTTPDAWAAVAREIINQKETA